ncbi:MAG: SurA N-terminal domain-containing protein [Pseudomonadota bacterium]
MLQNIRNNVGGTATKVVVGLIVISFAAFGLESILVSGGSDGTIAEVNGESVTSQEMQVALNTQRRQLIAGMGENFDPSLLNDEVISAQVLNALIGRKLLTQSAKDMDLSVSDREVGSVIGGMEEFKIDGKFSSQLFTSVLSSAGYTPAYFEQTLRDDIVVSQVRSGLAGSEFATPLELAINAQVVTEARDIRYLTVPLQNFLESIQITEDEIETYFNAHQEDFQTQESVVLEYIELGIDEFTEPVEEDAILEAYRLEVENGQYQTEHRVSHILFESSDEDQLQDSVAAAQEAIASGESFADVARRVSDDIGSSSAGGDLGVTTGDTFPEEMEEVIATIDLNLVSQPVVTDAGTHLIMVTERREGEAPPLEELRAQLTQQIQAGRARSDLLLAVEELKDLVFFQSDSLNQAAQDMGLTVQQSDAITRDQSSGLFSHPALISAAFSEDVMVNGNNSDVIELPDGQFVVLRQQSFNPSEPMELNEVRAEIESLLISQAARAAVASEAERIIDELVEGAEIDQLASSGGYSWQVELSADRSNTAVPTEVLARTFTMPVPSEGEKLLDYVLTPQGDAQVISLTRVSPGALNELDASNLVSLQRQLSGEYAQLLDTEYQRGLRDRADISVIQ